MKLTKKNEMNRQKYNPVLKSYLSKYNYADENVTLHDTPEGAYSLVIEPKPEAPRRDHKRYIPNPYVSIFPLNS